MRTGTNYLMRLINLNFKHVQVFASVLGWKHGLYDLGNARDDTKSHVEWVNKKTKGGVVYSVDNLPLLKHTPDQLIQACEHLNYIISIKKPVPFILSYKKFRQPNRDLTDDTIKMLCSRYNSNYRMWLELYENNTGMIVAHESVLLDYKHVLFNIQTQFNLQPSHNKLIDENKTVKASTDIGLIIDKQSNFNKDYYLNEEYLKELTDHQLNLIDNLIDNDLVDLIYKLSV